jgi:hypothetical protein
LCHEISEQGGMIEMSMIMFFEAHVF